MLRTVIILINAFILICCGSITSHALTPGSVSITVQDFYSAAAIEGATIVMNPGSYSGITDASGMVTFSGITPYRNYAVAVTANGYVEGKYGDGRTGFVSVETGVTTDVLIPMRKAATIHGLVTSSKGGPIVGAMVVIMEERMDGLEQVAVTRTEDDGSYILSNVPEGEVSIRAVADSYYQMSEDISVAAGQDIIKDFILAPGRTAVSFEISASKTYYGNSLSLSPDNLLLYFNQEYFMAVDIPEGAELLKSSE